jgi:hypothetical protein
MTPKFCVPPALLAAVFMLPGLVAVAAPPTKQSVAPVARRDALDGGRFRSVEKQERGRGGAMGYWTLAFDGGQFRSSSSDTIDGGTYAVARPARKSAPLAVTGQTGGLPVNAAYDPSTNTLTWDGVRYVRTNALDGLRFRSVERREVGLGPKGPVMGNWEVWFEKGEFAWRHSDIGESGPYESVGGKVEAHAGPRTIRGSYDARTGVLTWDGLRYRRVL